MSLAHPPFCPSAERLHKHIASYWRHKLAGQCEAASAPFIAQIALRRITRTFFWYNTDNIIMEGYTYTNGTGGGWYHAE